MIKIWSEVNEIKLPNKGDAGLDIAIRYPELIKQGVSLPIETGLYIEMPENCVGLIKERSSIGKLGIMCLGGVIDSSYRGEIKILLFNSGKEQVFERGHRIAQILFISLNQSQIQIVASHEEFTKTERGQNGFGSTGK